MAGYRLDIVESALSGVVQDVGRRRLASLQRRIANQARADVPVKTGNLGRSIREGEIKMVGPFRVEGSVEATADYAAAVHEGSRPYVIRPRKAKALRFQVGGRTVFAARVNHPGVRARPFLRNAAERIAAQES
ncbi:hypothetical protein [Mycolicibacterium sp.]|uniref:hypothetical protein n=1 Tax=Mycolicibacterium sp. TaxID=2320850 RepID=UPI00355FCDAB